MSVGTWHKPDDRMPVIGDAVIAAYPDGRHTVLRAYPESGGWIWTLANGGPALEPEFWFEPRVCVE